METLARAQYDNRPILASDLSFEGDKGVTKQSDLKDSDINAIFKRFEKTGQLPNMIAKNPAYGDFTNVPDYQDALHIVMQSNDQFANLDVNLRNRFDNDPAKFLEFATDPKNVEELAKLGLLKPEIVEARRAEAAQKAAEAKTADTAVKAAAKAALIAEIKAELNKPA
ncbi:MAG: internal scaffolding protein [Arizlama microvirus]|nr:MAG: internal scaffolding protein [Arizlama microvirus]